MEIKLNELSQSALSYLGDSVMELYVRTMLVKNGYEKSKNLNKAALSYVTATAQARAVSKILPHLDDEEAGVYRRGKNSSASNVPKSASCLEYKMATGLEALFGYLYLAERYDRIDEIFKIGYLDEENNNCN